MQDKKFFARMRVSERGASCSYVSVIREFLGNRKPNNYRNIVDVMFQNVQAFGARISIKLHHLSRCHRRRRLKGIHSRSNTNRTGAEGLSFYYSRRLHCLNQMLAVVLLSQHQVSSSKTVRPRASYGARCIGHAIRTWSAVYSEAPHSQFGERARPHLCMEEWNCPTPVRRQLSLTQAARGNPIPKAWHRSRAKKHGA